MLHQLLKENITLDEINMIFEPSTPKDVVSLMAKYHSQNLKDTTTILVVDGMHELMEERDDGLKTDTIFYKSLTYIASLVYSGLFLYLFVPQI